MKEAKAKRTWKETKKGLKERVKEHRRTGKKGMGGKDCRRLEVRKAIGILTVKDEEG